MESTRKADRVADDLLRQIVSRAIPVGALLPKESELASHYDVNRSVVREAIKLLEVHRLVHPVRRRGTIVLDPLASLSPEVVRAMLEPAPGQVDRAFFASLLEIRARIDADMTAVAALRRTDDDLAALDACVETVRAAANDRAGYEREVEHFPVLLARATKNVVFEMLCQWNRQVVHDLADVFRAARPMGGPHVDGLAVVVRLIREQKPDEVRALVDAYHAWAIPRLLAAAGLQAGAPLESIVNPEQTR